MNTLKTSKQWFDNDIENNHKYIILDPDGWDRKNYQYSFFEELITKDEYDRRLCNSTVKIYQSSVYGKFNETLLWEI